ncbi:sensor domain-containing diguanylate cyclase [Desulforamulus hydrothermalis]|uniref:Diguanylate cyclase n=1 Tax=Desulforamulus hydrothermalis Lam5 = DSM 18033 TaxID=1121428 RepID=K8E0X3_9FIRM|nr:MASE3 domain-containing protein [Desulforamulus hydrothermalis]CCO09304.1 Diguanylate cyclase [Desulforamulus hydrothermalis Lam5 = DSM 18033]SHH04535.1 diguanylate cyclase (GGDEF) domain-containing protein [Desulforamulus hydrothermalis Lam5 = DSM 18033]
MGITENTLEKLRMTNLGLKILLITLICSCFFMAVAWLGYNTVYQAEVFLPIHTNIEFFCVFVALSTFTVTWYSYLNNCSYYSYFIGLGLLAVGLIDLFHFYSYEGMPHIFSQACANKAMLFHLWGRLLLSVTFLASVFLYQKQLCFIKRFRISMLAVALLVVGIVFATVTWFPHLYPPMLSSGQNHTHYKTIAEYLIIVVLLGAVWGHLRLYKKHMDGYLQLIIAILVILVFSELCFAAEYSSYDTLNLLGHIFRFASYILIYAAIFINNVKRPYLQLVAAREELARSNSLLEEKVQERTKDLQQANEKLTWAASHDFLTGAINRLEFSGRLKILLENSQPQDVHCVIAIDFDSFKKINDTYGHAVGDECLKTFVRAAREVLRPSDSVARFGGDEFVLLLPYTPRAGARVAGEKVRAHLAKIAAPPFTISMGIAAWPADGRKEKELLNSADQALYLAKEKGKNRVE